MSVNYALICFPDSWEVDFENFAVVGHQTVDFDFHIGGLGVDGAGVEAVGH